MQLNNVLIMIIFTYYDTDYWFRVILPIIIITIIIKHHLETDAILARKLASDEKPTHL